MHWGRFWLALVAIALIQTVAIRLVPSSPFDAFLLLALLVSLTGPPADVRLAAWATGLVQDLASADPVGLHALALGLTALILTQLRELVNLSSLWVRALACALAALPGQLLCGGYVYFVAPAAIMTLTQVTGGALAACGLAGIAAAAIVSLPRYARRLRLRRV